MPACRLPRVHVYYLKSLTDAPTALVWLLGRMSQWLTESMAVLIRAYVRGMQCMSRATTVWLRTSKRTSPD